MKTLLISIVLLGVGIEALAHGRSEEMVKMLNAPVPEWMSLAEPIKVEPVEDQTLHDGVSFRPRSGGATNSGNRVQIPDRGIEFQVDYQIDYTGNNAAGRGASLSSDGTKLIVNSGTSSYLYEITSDGFHRELPIRLPNVTYDEGLKGFITKWAWAGDDVVIGRSGITDERGHEILESRLYVFHIKEQALARLDLSALNLPDDESLEVISIGEDLGHLRIRVGDRELAVKADLKSPPRLLPKQELAQPPKKTLGAVETPSTPNEVPAASTAWPVMAVVIVAVLGLLWLLLRKR